jgi:hypothetical protein
MMPQDCLLNNFAGTMKQGWIKDPEKLLLKNGRVSGVVPRKRHHVQASCSVVEYVEQSTLVI